MSFTLNIYGHNAASGPELEGAARQAFAAVAGVSTDAHGSLSGGTADGSTVSIVFPEAAPEADHEAGKLLATWSTKVVVRDAGLVDVVDIPTNAELEAVIVAAIVARFPQLTATATAERTDR